LSKGSPQLVGEILHQMGGGGIRPVQCDKKRHGKTIGHVGVWNVLVVVRTTPSNAAALRTRVGHRRFRVHPMRCVRCDVGGSVKRTHLRSQSCGGLATSDCHLTRDAFLHLPSLGDFTKGKPVYAWIGSTVHAVQCVTFTRMHHRPWAKNDRMWERMMRTEAESPLEGVWMVVQGVFRR